MKLATLMSGSGLAIILSLFAPVMQAQSTPAPTPPMGWNSWNHFAEHVTDKDVRAAADALVSSGMRDAGYVYVNIDDTWEGQRDAQGYIHPNKKFPDMKALADYVHSRGLKLGIYSSPGAKTCAGYEGSLGHEKQDAEMYAKWGVDYLKYDLCSYTKNLKDQAGDDHAKAQQVMLQVYTTMHDALQAAGRPIVLSLCQYGWEAVWRWGAETGGSLWRTTGDIEDSYASMEKIGFSQAGLAKFAGPGHWNDPDMLEVGNGGMSKDEYISHMTLWAMLAAPLLAGNDLAKMSEETKTILMNREVIAVDQDAAGHQGDRVYTEGPLEVWSKPLADGSLAVAIFSRWRMPLDFDVPMSKLGYGATEPVKARDLWAHRDLDPIVGSFHTTLRPHSVVLLRLSR
ncbi:MAG: glycoside hydrolase family 27 protein [Acidobacteriaceae bacterium]|nr:glycoside hydrolase family 27 protein [Acidobacteriaceae bacterium]